MAGCAGPPTQTRAYTAAAQGLDVTGTGLSVSFGRAEAGARAAIVKLAGRQVAEQAVPGCGTRVLHADGLAVTYGEGRFLGWALADGRSAGRPCQGVRARPGSGPP